jgi:hypothetical protein
MSLAYHAYNHDDVFCHPECLISLEEAGLEEWNTDTVHTAQEEMYADEDCHDTYH